MVPRGWYGMVGGPHGSPDLDPRTRTPLSVWGGGGGLLLARDNRRSDKTTNPCYLGQPCNFNQPFSVVFTPNNGDDTAGTIISAHRIAKIVFFGCDDAKCLNLRLSSERDHSWC